MVISPVVMPSKEGIHLFDFTAGKPLSLRLIDIVMVRLDRTIQKRLKSLRKKPLLTPGRAFWILRSSRRMTKEWTPENLGKHPFALPSDIFPRFSPSPPSISFLVCF
jgi:hypothetical protein